VLFPPQFKKTSDWFEYAFKDNSKEVIFALPSFQMTLRTEHLDQQVTCAFDMDFEDHIFVAVDAEAYFFLHELVSSYLKDRPPAEEDSRDFKCDTWRLEPTVRLLSWSKNIEPYGVDYVLQRLGFSQARTTIPKWIQRGLMDPLHHLVSERLTSGDNIL